MAITQGFTEQIRYEYPSLDENSIVIDAGAYEGQWALQIFHRYHCAIYAFEPMPPHHSDLEEKFKGTKIQLVPAGLGAYTRYTVMGLKGDMSGQHTDGPLSRVLVISANHFIAEKVKTEVDLLKLNVEGMEYEILESMLKPVGTIDKIKNLQIQFHGVVNHSGARYAMIRESLQETHELTHDYGMVWQLWRLK